MRDSERQHKKKVVCKLCITQVAQEWHKREPQERMKNKKERGQGRDRKREKEKEKEKVCFCMYVCVCVCVCVWLSVHASNNNIPAWAIFSGNLKKAVLVQVHSNAHLSILLLFLIIPQFLHLSYSLCEVVHASHAYTLHSCWTIQAKQVWRCQTALLSERTGKNID